jgi:predicted enzyme related to lactoylglutathione lyase
MKNWAAPGTWTKSAPWSKPDQPDKQFQPQGSLRLIFCHLTEQIFYCNIDHIGKCLSRKGKNMAKIVHFELPSGNPAASRKFYEAVLDWKIERWPGEEDYFLITAGETSEPGINGAIGGAATGLNTTLIIVGVADVDKTVALAIENGGTVIYPANDIPQVGRLAYIQDPQGATIGVLQPLPGSTMR